MRLIPLVLVCAVIAGCGGGDGASKAAKTTFVKQAEAICTQAVADRKALPVPLTLPQLVAYAKSLVAIADRTAGGLLALKPPASDSKQLTAKVLGPLQEQLAAGHRFLDQVSAAQRAKDDAQLRRLFADPPTKTKADLRWMKRYGFSSCVDAADTSG